MSISKLYFIFYLLGHCCVLDPSFHPLAVSSHELLIAATVLRANICWDRSFTALKAKLLDHSLCFGRLNDSITYLSWIFGLKFKDLIEITYIVEGLICSFS
jgi:hypothetical protein